MNVSGIVFHKEGTRTPLSTYRIYFQKVPTGTYLPTVQYGTVQNGTVQNSTVKGE